MQKVGIYSGTFDPVHTGHTTFAHEAIKQCGLDKVFFLVEPRPRRKQGVKGFEHRNRMVQLATRDEAKFGSIILEQQRFTVPETLPVLLERFHGAELCLLIGDDGLDHLNAWPHVEELLAKALFIIGRRRLAEGQIKRQIKDIEEIRDIKVRYQLFKAPEPEVSSSSIKQSLKRGHTPKGVPPAVIHYIQQERLYAPSASGSK